MCRRRARLLKLDGSYSVVNERPPVGTIESAHADRCNELRIEVPEVDAVLAARSWLQWFPVCDTPTRPAVDGAQRFVSPDVLCGCFRMPLDFDGTVLKVDPRPTNASAQGTVAGGGYLWRRRQFQPNCAAVAGAFVHLRSPRRTGLNDAV